MYAHYATLTYLTGEGGCGPWKGLALRARKNRTPEQFVKGKWGGKETWGGFTENAALYGVELKGRHLAIGSVA